VPRPIRVLYSSSYKCSSGYVTLC